MIFQTTSTIVTFMETVVNPFVHWRIQQNKRKPQRNLSTYVTCFLEIYQFVKNTCFINISYFLGNEGYYASLRGIYYGYLIVGHFVWNGKSKNPTEFSKRDL